MVFLPFVLSIEYGLSDFLLPYCCHGSEQMDCDIVFLLIDRFDVLEDFTGDGVSVDAARIVNRLCVAVPELLVGLAVLAAGDGCLIGAALNAVQRVGDLRDPARFHVVVHTGFYGLNRKGDGASGPDAAVGEDGILETGHGPNQEAGRNGCAGRSGEGNVAGRLLRR